MENPKFIDLKKKTIGSLYKCRINVHLLLITNNQILMIKRKNTGFQDGMFSLPAGKLEKGETIKKALIRETKEEIGMDAFLSENWTEKTYILHRFTSSETIAIDFFVLPQEFNGKPCNMEPHKCDEVRWFGINNLPKNTIPYIKKAIENVTSGLVFDEYPWEL